MRSLCGVVRLVHVSLLTFTQSINHCFVIVQTPTPPAPNLLSAITDAVSVRSASGIASTVNRLISSGELPAGERLPTVRLLANRLGVSPSTVSEAWQVLGEAGSIAARGRQGTVVVGRQGTARPTRYRNVTGGQYALDLSTGTPDPDLLPDLNRVLASVARNSLTTSYLDDPVFPPLGAQLHSTWPFAPEALTVVDGCMDALDRLASSMVRLGDRVAVENPTFPPLLDLLEQLGAEIVPLALDDQGVTVDSLRSALTFDPVLVFLQPRAHNPTGVSSTADRVRHLADVLGGSRALVIEDDHANDIATAALSSIGEHLPDRTIHVARLFEKPRPGSPPGRSRRRRRRDSAHGAASGARAWMVVAAASGCSRRGAGSGRLQGPGPVGPGRVRPPQTGVLTCTERTRYRPPGRRRDQRLDSGRKRTRRSAGPGGAWHRRCPRLPVRRPPPPP